MPKVLIADDHPLFRDALTAALSPLIDNLQVVEADSLDTTHAQLQANPDIDLLLLDLNMPGCEHYAGLRQVKSEHGNCRFAVISASESIEVVNQVMSMGAAGFIPKSSPSAKIAEAITAIINGQAWLPPEMRKELDKITAENQGVSQKLDELTPKQIQVLRHLQQGKMNKQIAYEMHVTEATIKAHISAILRKLDVNTRTQAVLMVEKLQLVD